MKRYKFAVHFKNGTVMEQIVLGDSPEDAAKEFSLRNDVESFEYIGPA
ncbi:hypothetical protein J0667_18620 [Methylomonas sp. WH-1]|nr:hypothetical protein [Methylomonas sp. LW13]